LNLLWCRFK